VAVVRDARPKVGGENLVEEPRQRAGALVTEGGEQPLPLAFHPADQRALQILAGLLKRPLREPPGVKRPLELVPRLGERRLVKRRVVGEDRPRPEHVFPSPVGDQKDQTVLVTDALGEFAFHHHDILEQRADGANGFFQIKTRQGHGQLRLAALAAGLVHQELNFVVGNPVRHGGGRRRTHGGAARA
jgi:hypothetical protein